MGDLLAGVAQAPGDDIGRVLGPALQAGAQLEEGRREDEDAHHVLVHLLDDLAGPLPVDVEHHVLADAQGLLHGLARRAVEVAVHLGPFQEVPAIAQTLEVVPSR
jgi:hypothetical protein